MDIAVLADIHGNYLALKKCIEYALMHKVETFIFLGDYIGELAYPEKTMQILYDLMDTYECYFIKGNKEDYWLNYQDNGENGWRDKNSTSGSLLYAYKSLTDRDLEFFRRLNFTREIAFGKMDPITICHGSPNKTNEKMLPGNDHTIEIMNKTKTPIILCGHTHVQSKFVNNLKCLLNPGSVGVSLFSEGRTQFLILHGSKTTWSEEFVSLEYNVDDVINDMYNAKLNEHAPYWSLITETILRGGNISHGRILSKAMELCKEKTGVCVWPDIPEEYWEQAVNEILEIQES